MAARKKKSNEKSKPAVESRKAKAEKSLAAVREAEQQARTDAEANADVVRLAASGKVVKMRVIAPQGFGMSPGIWVEEGSIIEVSAKMATELDHYRLASQIQATGGDNG